MAKIALLIGVSEYEPGLTPLPAAVKDVKAIQQVLEAPEIGGFDEVKLLKNPEPVVMGEAIQTLFASREKDDLVVLFFSGHGIKDESGILHLATRITRKNAKGELVNVTAIPASFVHDIMSKSLSRRQVVILDCCFSGAFANGMSARDDGFVDVKNQLFLGKEGRAVLTSSTSTQYSFEQQGAELSTYTQYIVDGLESGAADRDRDGWISVDELHEYAQRKVQEASPAMNPQIYAIKEGYKIQLAKAPTNNPKLKYRQEVDYWASGVQISDIGRDTLDELRNSLELTPEETKAIEDEVLKPFQQKESKLQRYKQAFLRQIQREYPISDDTRQELTRFQKVLQLTDENIAKIENSTIEERQRKLHEYEQAFLQAIQRECPISDDTRNQLIGVQQNLGLRHEDIALIEASLIAETQRVLDPVNKTTPNENRQFPQHVKMLLIGIIGGIVIGGIIVYVIIRKTAVQISINSCVKEQHSLGDQISLGEKVLLQQQDTNRAKEDGVQAFARGDCEAAMTNFNSYLKGNRSDPEALIYLNNAKARQQVNHLTIAVSVPIGKNPDVAKEILRGVAQAQDEVNGSSGINHKLLQVVIANDNNDRDLAHQVATQFVKDSSILAVVGHNASEASISAAQVYQQSGLVMISPTSFAENLSDIGKYIFRTVPSSDDIVVGLSSYIINKTAKTNIAICFDSNSIEARSFKTVFRNAIQAAGRRVNPTNCDLSAPTLNPSTVISQAINSGADGLLLAPYIDRINKALSVAQANQTNQRRLDLFGNSTLYTNQTLKDGQADINGMILAVSWYPQAIPGNTFIQNARQLWGGPVNWRTAMAYDATRAIITGLEQSSTRDGLQKVLQSPTFSANGATGTIQFSPSRDRNGNAILVKVQANPHTDTGYEFGELSP